MNQWKPGATEEQLQLLAELFKMLGDPTRLRILYLLSEECCCVSDIADRLGMGQSAISHQLRVLRQTRLVTSRRDGKMVVYGLNDAHVETLISQGLEHVMHD